MQHTTSLFWRLTRFDCNSQQDFPAADALIEAVMDTAPWSVQSSNLLSMTFQLSWPIWYNDLTYLPVWSLWYFSMTYPPIETIWYNDSTNLHIWSIWYYSTTNLLIGPIVYDFMTCSPIWLTWFHYLACLPFWSIWHDSVTCSPISPIWCNCLTYLSLKSIHHICSIFLLTPPVRHTFCIDTKVLDPKSSELWRQWDSPFIRRCIHVKTHDKLIALEQIMDPKPEEDCSKSDASFFFFIGWCINFKDKEATTSAPSSRTQTRAFHINNRRPTYGRENTHEIRHTGICHPHYSEKVKRLWRSQTTTRQRARGARFRAAHSTSSWCAAQASKRLAEGLRVEISKEQDTNQPHFLSQKVSWFSRLRHMRCDSCKHTTEIVLLCFKISSNSGPSAAASFSHERVSSGCSRTMSSPALCSSGVAVLRVTFDTATWVDFPSGDFQRESCATLCSMALRCVS